MTTGLPFSDRRQRPRVAGLAVDLPHPAPRSDRTTAARPNDFNDPTAASHRGRSCIDIAPATDGPGRPRRDVLG